MGEMEAKKKQNPEYQLALWESSISDESRKNTTDPEAIIHKINNLRKQLAEAQHNEV